VAGARREACLFDIINTVKQLEDEEECAEYKVQSTSGRVIVGWTWTPMPWHFKVERRWYLLTLANADASLILANHNSDFYDREGGNKTRLAAKARESRCSEQDQAASVKINAASGGIVQYRQKGCHWFTQQRLSHFDFAL
jgi:hypothetical protein